MGRKDKKQQQAKEEEKPAAEKNAGNAKGGKKEQPAKEGACSHSFRSSRCGCHPPGPGPGWIDAKLTWACCVVVYARNREAERRQEGEEVTILSALPSLCAVAALCY
ncbi:unnamed protein product [Phytophthora fragariaefolia]|uniref:Unnamed protein product n=1 Tax=Phytophthora fragariaefolia TaxID=1490495 RepID=A0A9W6YR30_9STRA|nr:unnamed protein product [Phytophthora fragariaefolia]